MVARSRPPLRRLRSWRSLSACALAALALGTATLASADSANRPAIISVSVSLGSCDRAGAGTQCRLDVSFTAVAEADTYGALITAPDGSILERGAADPSGSSYSVPYVGDGTYTVRITAYGTFAEPSNERTPIASGQSS